MTSPTHVKVAQVMKVYRTFTQPYLVEGDDGNLYVLKHASAAADTKMLAGEYLATKVGVHMNAPVLDCGIIEVDQDAVEIFEAFPSRLGAPIPDLGLHYASVHRDGLPASENDLNVLFEQRSKVLNSHKASYAVVFDSLFHNHDGHAGNVLISFPDSGKKTEFEVHLIDQGHILKGPGWAALSTPGHWTFLGARAQFYKEHGTTTKLNLSNTQADLATVTTTVMDNLISQIPATWGLDATTASSIRSYVINRIPRACSFVEENLTFKGF